MALLLLFLHLFVLGFVDILLLLLFCDGFLHVGSIFRPLKHRAEHLIALLNAEAIRHAHIQLRGLVDIAFYVDVAELASLGVHALLVVLLSGHTTHVVGRQLLCHYLHKMFSLTFTVVLFD